MFQEKKMYFTIKLRLLQFLTAYIKGLGFSKKTTTTFVQSLNVKMTLIFPACFDIQ